MLQNGPFNHLRLRKKTTQNGLYYGSGPGIHSDSVVVSFISYQHCKNNSEQKVTSTNTPGEMVFWKNLRQGTWDMTGLRPVKYIQRNKSETLLKVGGWTNPFEEISVKNGFIFPNFHGENKTNNLQSPLTLQGINISHLGKFGKSSSKCHFLVDMLVSWRVVVQSANKTTQCSRRRPSHGPCSLATECIDHILSRQSSYQGQNKG